LDHRNMRIGKGLGGGEKSDQSHEE
jgi:hypothetical protein